LNPSCRITTNLEYFFVVIVQTYVVSPDCIMKSERLLLLTLAAGMFTHIVDFMIIMPLGPQLQRLFEINPQEFSLLVASYSITAGIAGFAGAFFIDRVDRKKSMLFIYGGFTIGTFACAFAPNFEILLATRSLTGAFGGILGALILSIVSDTIPLERRAKGIGTVMASFGVASVVGVPFGLFIASKTSWHAPFLALGALGAITFAGMYFYIPALTKHIEKASERSAWEVIGKIFTTRNTQLGLTFTSLLMLGHFTIIPFLATYMVGNVGFSDLELSYIYLVGGACTLVFSPWVGKMADKHGRLRIFTIFGILVLIPIFTITNLPPVPLWFGLFLAGIFFIFSNGRMVPSTTMETAVVAPEMRGVYMSIRSSIQQLTSGLASFLAGVIVTEQPSPFGSDIMALVNYNYAGFIAIFFSIVSLFIARKLTVVKGA
jgi:MFS transporter, DHA1 family, inner membrane transport protein